jgi:ribosomal protein L35AE/L33A
VNLPGTDLTMIEALEGASSFELYQLKALIEGMLSDPRRGIAARAELHLGQPVQFVDFRDGQVRRGKIIAMRDTQATVLEVDTKRTWKIPCMAMKDLDRAHAQDEHAHYERPPEPIRATTLASGFQQGDTVTFDDRDGRNVTGVIVRINQRTATLGTSNGGTWRVPFHMLRHVLDV